MQNDPTMPNKTHPETGYYPRSQCAQQTNQQQYIPYQIPTSNTYNVQNHNLYDIMYPATRNQYPQGTPNVYEHVDNWFPDPRIISDIEKGLRLSDKIETIEISSKDLSPASCCSNIDLLLPDFYKNTKISSDGQWYYNGNKNYVEYPSCSQINCEQDGLTDKTVKYCSIQKNNYDYNQYVQSYEKNDCNVFSQDNSLLNISDVFRSQDMLQFDSVPCLGQRTESSNGESDIIVEESDDDYVEDPQRKFNCVVCDLAYSPVGDQFYFLTSESPLTMSTQKPVYSKIKDLVDTLPETNNYLCSLCLGLINTIDHLQLKLDGCKSELLAKIKNGSKPEDKCKHKFNCKVCKKVFTLDGIYKNHMLRHKTTKRFLCEVCGRSFNKYKRFTLHAKTHDNGARCSVRKVRIDAFQCQVCSKAFRTRSNLKEHENYCSGRLPYKCRHCHKKFATTTKLKNHVKLKHDKKFTSICSICNIGFVKVSHHKAHMISHSADKKYPCTQCDKSYKTSSNLKFHMKFHNRRLPFICTICDKGFMRREYLESHTSSHTGDRNHHCIICDKKFFSQKNLDAHAKLHDGNVNKKACNVCGKMVSKGLEDHLRTHANLKEFECGQCELRFNTRSGLTKHKKRKHLNSEEFK